MKLKYVKRYEKIQASQLISRLHRNNLPNGIYHISGFEFEQFHFQFGGKPTTGPIIAH